MREHRINGPSRIIFTAHLNARVRRLSAAEQCAYIHMMPELLAVDYNAYRSSFAPQPDGMIYARIRHENIRATVRIRRQVPRFVLFLFPYLFELYVSRLELRIGSGWVVL